MTSNVRHQSSGSISQVAPSGPPIPGVGDEQVDRSRFGDSVLDRLAVGDVERDGAAADLVRDRLDLFRRARSNDDLPAILGELAGDVRPDSATSPCDERDHAGNGSRGRAIGAVGKLHARLRSWRVG